jgi:hypothetical protein
MYSQPIAACTVIFHSAELLLIDYGGDPFVPIRPVVDAIGLSWKSQRAKLKSRLFASAVIDITVVAHNGQYREMTCLPLRKLPRWLMRLPRHNVQRDVGKQILTYQQECDDALWIHWLKHRQRDGRGDLAESSLSPAAAAFTAEYLAECRGAIAAAGGILPAWNPITEERVASGMALKLLRNKRWLVTFGHEGMPELQVIPHNAGVFTPEKMLSWIRGKDGAVLSMMPDLLAAIGERLRNATS